jgi:hypothetical protein
VGPLAAGSSLAAEWFEKSLQSDIDGQAILLLVGAPGNGKSFISDLVTRKLESLDQPTQKHRRKYNFRAPNGRRLAVVNDATIPSGELYASGDLVRDIDSCIASGESLLINVNRGVVYDELRTVGRDRNSEGREVVEWVSGRFKNSSLSLEFLDDCGDPEGSPLRRAVLQPRASTKTIAVGAVFMDGCSLFEASVGGEQIEFNHEEFPRLQTPYSVRSFKERDPANSDLTPAGSLIRDFASRFPAPPMELSGLLDPFAANLAALRDERIRSGILRIFRASEIVSSSHMSYRELWGAIAIAVLGPELCDPRSQGSRDVSEPVGWLESVQPRSDIQREWLLGLMRLGNCRTHQGLFGDSPSLLSSTATPIHASPTFDLLRRVDPVKDAIAGAGSGGGWAAYVYDAFMSRSDDSSILEDLLLLLPDDDPVRSYVTPLDKAIDAAVCAALRDSKVWLDNSEGDRRALISWYSEYLLRMYALCHGHCAFETEVDEWTTAWTYAVRTKRVTPLLAEGFRSLLLPAYESGQRGYSLLPLFDARVEPIVDEPVEPRLALRATSSVVISARVEDDQIFLDLNVTDGSGYSSSSPVISLALDFGLLRECLASSEVSRGLIELSNITTPRIERFRSALLRGNSGNLELVVVGRGINTQLNLPIF